MRTDHPLYLPSEWRADGSKKYPVIVEYMGNGPFNDGFGDISTGRPEDSNLGWGFAEPAGSRYIWISMPMLSADLGNDTEISTYWWGCPSTNAGSPCGAAFNIAPTITYLHSALKQTVRTLCCLGLCLLCGCETARTVWSRPSTMAAIRRVWW